MNRFSGTLICLLLLLLPLLAHAQLGGKGLVDSLLKELPKYKEDTNKLKLLDDIVGPLGDNYPDEGIRYAQQQLALAIKLNDSNNMARAYMHTGYDYERKRDYPQALGNLMSALDIFRRSKNLRFIARECNRIGDVYQELKKYDSSLSYYEQGLAIYESRGEKESAGEILLQISFVYKLKGNYAKTLEYSSRLLKLASGFDSLTHSGFEMAIEGVAGEAYLGIVADNYKKAGLKNGKAPYLDSALKYINKGVKDNERVGNLSNAAEFSDKLSDAYVLTGDYKNAFEAIKHAHVLQDSVRNKDDSTADDMKEMVNQLNESQISNENKQLESEKKQKILFIAGIGLLLLLVLFVLKNVRDQKMANLQIKQEKEEISKLKNEIEERHRHTLDSVTYAQRIQAAILPPVAQISEALPQSFVLFRPKDMVSGDFYWFATKGDSIIIAAVDCTGHGVPGAFMSMIGNTLLNEILNTKAFSQPGDILIHLDQAVNDALKQNINADSKDGMDIAVCILDRVSYTLSFAGANRPLYLFQKDANGATELREYKGSKFPVGSFEPGQVKKFESHVISVAPGDTFYLFTDGYADQFGGAKGKKLMTANFKKMLHSIQDTSMQEQQKKLDLFFEDWRGANEQVDDVLVIGVQV